MADDSRQTSVGERYARALFDLAKDEKRISAVGKDLKELKGMLAGSAELRALVGSPRFSAENKGKGLSAIAAKAKFNDTTRKFLGLLAANGRAAALGAVISSFEKLDAAERGVVSAEVTSAVPLTSAQARSIAVALRQALGKDPEIQTRVDPAILGGLKVRVGSRLYDASLKSKLDQLKFALKRA